MDEFAEHRWRQRLMGVDMVIHMFVNIATLAALGAFVYWTLRKGADHAS